MVIPASTLALINFGAQAIGTIAPMIAANNVERDSHGRPKGLTGFGHTMKIMGQAAGALSLGLGAYNKFMDLKAPATSKTGGTDGTGEALKAAKGASKEQGGILNQLMNNKDFDPGDLAKPFEDTGIGKSLRINQDFNNTSRSLMDYSGVFDSDNPYR